MNGYFKIRPAGRHLATIGRDLIQDPYAAIVELVKNAYDADATKVELSFENKDNSKIEIIINDDGHGMSEDVVVNKWMVPSTDDKKIRKVSPNGRIMQGRKGIGRYAAAVLGNDLFLETVCIDNNEKTSVFVDWTDFEKAEYLSDVDILIETEKTSQNKGTKLSITGDASFLSEWTDNQFKHLEKELKKLMTPLEDTKVSSDSIFEIYITIKGFGNIDVLCNKIEPYPLFDLFDYRISGQIDSDGNGVLIYEMQKARNSVPEEIQFSYDRSTKCGSIGFDIRVFDREKEAIEDLISRGLKDDSGNFIGKLDARRLLNENNGIGVYRNGFRLRPLGDPDFDWLELNKSRVQNPSKKIGSDQVIGIVKIEDEEKSGLIEKSARDGLKENIAYSSLRELTKCVIEKLEERRFIYRNKAGIGRKTLKLEAELEKIFSFDILKTTVSKTLEKNNINKTVSSEIMGAIDEQEKAHNAAAQSLRETVAIYQGQATMGKIVNVIIHEGRKPLGFFKDQIPFFIKQYDNYQKGNINELPLLFEKVRRITANSEILVNLFKKIDPLATGRKGMKRKEFLKTEIEHAISVFSSELDNIEWSVKTSTNNDIQIECWKQDIYSIFTNLVENSIFWMQQKNTDKKEISIFINILKDRIEFIDYKDTGPGIERHLIESGVIFEPEFSTRTEGGTGLGLSIAGEAAQRCGFELKALYSDTGAYFRLECLENNK